MSGLEYFTVLFVWYTVSNLAVEPAAGALARQAMDAVAPPAREEAFIVPDPVESLDWLVDDTGRPPPRSGG